MPVLWTAKRVAPMTATEHSGLGPTRTEIRDTVIRMRADLAHRWTLAELAQDAHLSPSRLGGRLTPDLGHADSSTLLGKRESKGWLDVMSGKVVVDPADGRGSDRGVVPVMIVEVQPTRQRRAAFGF